MELNWAAINGSAHVGKGGELFEGLGGLDQPATTNGNLNKFRVELGGEEAGYHVGDLGDEVGFKRVASGEGFGGESMGETREDHSDGIVGRQREIGKRDVRLELLDDGGEDRVGQAVERAPLGITERSFEGPDVLGRESAEGGDGVVGVGGVGVGGRRRRRIDGVAAVGGSRGRGWARGDDVGEDRGDGEEEKRRGGGGGEEGGGG